MMLSTLLTMGVLVLVLASDAGNALADETPQSDHAAVLQPCDATSDEQKWVLRAGAKWGDANTLLNFAEDKAALCMDIAHYSTKAGAEVRGWQCCCTGSPYCGGCGDPTKNANQAYITDPKSEPPNQVKTGAAMGELCLIVDKAEAGQYVHTGPCPTIDSDPNFIFYAATAPHLRVGTNKSLCLATPSGSAPPPGPGPAPGPGRPVPQACTSANSSAYAFCDASLPTPARVLDLLKRMTLEEKLGQLVGGIGGGITPAVPRLGVPEYQYHSEGLHGIRDTKPVGDSTLFPQVTAMAATGNLTLVHAMADQMGDEARAGNNAMQGRCTTKGLGLNYWGPTMNVARDPRWGRIQESVSEDPWLNGAYSSNFVKGLQASGDGVKFTKIAACCKHFYAYSLEGADNFTRHNFNAIISKRDLAETYGPPFEACVAAKPEQVMCSYNAVNGVPTCLDGDAQNGWLRDKLGWQGLIVSDCDAVGDAYSKHHYTKDAPTAAAEGINNGCDQDCGSTYKAANLQDALSRGLLNNTMLDLALGRAFTMRMNLGMFDKAATVAYTKIGLDAMNNARGQALALAAARQSIILLQNRKNALPLDASKLKGKTVAMVGPTGDDAHVMMGGKSDYAPAFTITLCQGLQQRANRSGFTAVCDDGSDTEKAVALAKSADVVLATMGGVLGSEGRDRTDIGLPGDQPALLRLLIAARPDLMLVLVNGEPVAVDEAKDKVDTIVEAMEGGQSAGTALADVLFGDTSPSGLLPFTMYRSTYVNEVKMSDMTLRPNAVSGSKGKTYRFYTGEVLWPFGHGLSYTTWKLSWGAPPPACAKSNKCALPTATLRAGVVFKVQLQNTGKVGSAKIVQLFIKKLGDTDAPIRSLFAMEKVFVPAGANVTLSLSSAALAGFCSFCTVDPDGTKAIKAGTQYAISIGDGSSVAPFVIAAV